jgi:hypothetical protein
MPIDTQTPAHSFLRMVDPKNGLAPGDPDQMAARISKSVDVESAPLRMVLGSQALEGTLTTPAQTQCQLRTTDRTRRFDGLSARTVTCTAPSCPTRHLSKQIIL